MQFWIIEKGEKVGPVEDYELREMIREKRVEAGTKVWHEGAEEWERADQVRVLAAEFEEVKEEGSVVEALPVETGATELYLVRRVFARLLDYFIYHSLFFLGLVLAGAEIFPSEETLRSGSQMLMRAVARLVPMFLVEGLVLHLFGTSPGKWLLSLRVLDEKGQKLALGRAVMRSVRVFILGFGMFILPFLLVGAIGNLVVAKKKGAPLWDLFPPHVVVGQGLRPGRVVLMTVLPVLVSLVVSLIATPFLDPEEIKEFEKKWTELFQRPELD